MAEEKTERQVFTADQFMKEARREAKNPILLHNGSGFDPVIEHDDGFITVLCDDGHVHIIGTTYRQAAVLRNAEALAVAAQSTEDTRVLASEAARVASESDTELAEMMSGGVMPEDWRSMSVEDLNAALSDRQGVEQRPGTALLTRRGKASTDPTEPQRVEVLYGCVGGATNAFDACRNARAKLGEPGLEIVQLEILLAAGMHVGLKDAGIELPLATRAVFGGTAYHMHGWWSRFALRVASWHEVGLTADKAKPVPCPVDRFIMTASVASAMFLGISVAAALQGVPDA